MSKQSEPMVLSNVQSHRDNQTHLTSPMRSQLTERDNEIRELQAKLKQSMELQGYYQKMTEDYRSKFLAIEKQLNVVQHTQDYEVQKQR
jgi:hypothetical protein